MRPLDPFPEAAYDRYAAQKRPTSGNAPAPEERPSTTKALHAGPFRGALCRTRTGDPFLTMAGPRRSRTARRQPNCLQRPADAHLQPPAAIRTVRHPRVPREYLELAAAEAIVGRYRHRSPSTKPPTNAGPTIRRAVGLRAARLPDHSPRRSPSRSTSGQTTTFRSPCRLRLQIRVVLVHPREHFVPALPAALCAHARVRLATLRGIPPVTRAALDLFRHTGIVALRRAAVSPGVPASWYERPV